MNDSKIVIKDGYVLTMDRNLGDFEKADILIEGTQIREIAPAISAQDCQEIDASSMIVLPGFVDTHRHVWQTQLRNVAADWTLFDYVAIMRWIYGSHYRPQNAYIGNYVGALEALNAGITTLVDHAHIMNTPEHADEAIRGLQNAGIRAVFCYGMYGNPVYQNGVPPASLEGIVPSPEWHYDDVLRIKKRFFSTEDQLLSMGIAMNDLENFPIEFAKKEIELAREICAKTVSTHTGMGAMSAGRNFIENLAAANVLGPELLCVHGSSLSDGVLKLMADIGCAVSSTPETEMQMGMGFPVMGRALSAGVKASIGVDIVSNYSGDMFSQMRLALQTERALRNHELEKQGFCPRNIKFGCKEILDLCTLGGAKAARLEDKIGSLTPGKEADIILVRTDSLNMAPVNDPVGAVVLNANPNDVDTVLVAGRFIKRSGQLVGPDLPKTIGELTESRDYIVKITRPIFGAFLDQIKKRLTRALPLEKSTSDASAF